MSLLVAGRARSYGPRGTARARRSRAGSPRRPRRSAARAPRGTDARAGAPPPAPRRRGPGWRRRPPPARSRWRAASPSPRPGSPAGCPRRRRWRPGGRAAGGLRRAWRRRRAGARRPGTRAAAGRTPPGAPRARRPAPAPPAPSRPRAAPTEGRKRSSVPIATAKPRSTSPSTWSRGTATPSKRSRPIGCGATSAIRSPDRPSASPGTSEGRDPAGAALAARAREDGVDVGVGRVGDVDLLAGEPEAVAVGLGAQGRARRRRSPPPARSARRRRPPRRPRAAAASAPRAPPTVLQDRERAEPLHRERRLRLGARAREALADQAQVHRGLAENNRSSSPCAAIAASSGRLTSPGVPSAAIGASSPRGELGASREQLALGLAQVRVERRHGSGLTATAISSIFASTSNRRTTPNRPAAG